MADSLGNFFVEGGSVMYVILVALILAVLIAVERFYFVFFRFNINGENFMRKIQQLVEARNYERAIQLCNAVPRSALAKVVKAGLVKAGQDPRDIQNSVDEAALEILPKLTKRTGFLQVIANVATLLGLLGTIFGIILAFKAVAEVDPSMKQVVLTKGIAVALYTTAFGLIVAIPSMVAHALVESSTTKIIDEIDEYSVKLINQLAAKSQEDRQTA
ncbi:MAG: MotA/TolQ/ExbB proton channel family protein [Deltaproteobacteria bacterium]|nr:MotA/TolQ/ExbB proton channel family protein [bacterium]MCB9476024.1 MotA/TolQ/ExbB proton channel family protein [Deltaproteobacteria bacterium]MCB9478287.1 MotA/TolQ/ExbB proton channel family protein [Deltaproteobacteria bacterium]MCB9487161.1 MotA/TolQ/ExbB proton channel family protein [Deltaproteobacteria bacterium]